jgi:diguanylate cyclase (GGDEF)-like protein
MTLLRQLMIVIVLIFMMLFSANFVLTVYESRVYLDQQLRAHAQDTATSLGVSMATALAESDNANLNVLAGAVFDRGFYQHITLIDLDGEVLVRKSNSMNIDDVPPWFVKLVNLPSPAASTEITSGWSQLGTLTVIANPAHAYRDLWRITTDYLYLFCFIVIFSYGFIGLVLRFVLRPLLAVEQQANDICERRFTINETIPKTRELRRVVEAMNRMTQKIHEMFDRQVKLTENLRDEARIDHLTGLSNRKEFNALTTALLKTEGGGPGPSALMLMQIKDFADINTSLGRDAGDALLSQVATRLQAAVQNRKGAILARYNGADFAIFLPSVSLEHARVTLQGCFNAVASLKTFTDEALVDAIHIGMTFDSQPQQLAGMLTEADAALRNAQSGGHSNAYFLVHGDSQNHLTDIIKQASDWKHILEHAIEDQQVIFHFQQVFTLPDRQPLAEVIYVRISLDDKVVQAGVFMPMAERFNLLASLDQLIITRAFEEITAYSPTLIINLSTRSIQDDEFIQWLSGHIRDHRALASKVIFELPEYAVHLAYDTIKRFVDSAGPLGYRFSIGHFGLGTIAFSYLQSLDVHFIKVDRSFVTDIATNTDNQFFIQSVVQIAHTRDMLLIAEGVETEADLATLERLGVDAAMGYLLGRPGPRT